MYHWINVILHLLSFVCSFYALTCIKFEKFTNVREPVKVQVLLLLLSMALGTCVAQFLMNVLYFN